VDNNQPEDVIGEARSIAEKAGEKFDLDFSLESLRRVDALLGELGDCGDPGDDFAGKAAYMMGCYVGEVLVRQAGAEWVFEEDKKEMFGSPLFLRVGQIQASPMSRCFKRMKSDSDGVEGWGRLLAALASSNFGEEKTDARMEVTQ
jgi:hypothetical protein